MKKQAAAQQGAPGKGMMGVVLPMYAVGIVIYLVYTMTKVGQCTVITTVIFSCGVIPRLLSKCKQNFVIMPIWFHQ